MSGYRPWGGGALGGPPAQSVAQEVQALKDELGRAMGGNASKILDLEAKLNVAMAKLSSGMVAFPEQFHLGVVKYPDRYPFPMDLSLELRNADGQPYGITNDVTRAIIQVDVDNPSILQRISFDLYKPDVLGNTGLIGAYLPLSSKNWNGYLMTADGAGAVTYDYQGRDFQWRIRTSSDDRIWQSGWRSSADLDGYDQKGYVLPTEYELRRNDSLIIEAQPIGPVRDPEQTWTLNVHLHIYKMLQKREQQ